MLVCDTDFLLKIRNEPLPNFDRQWLHAQELVTILQVVRELRGISHGRSVKLSRAARAVLDTISNNREITVKSLHTGVLKTSDTDNALTEFVRWEPEGRMLASLDGALLSRFERLRLPYLTLRNDRIFCMRQKGQRIY